MIHMLVRKMALRAHRKINRKGVASVLVNLLIFVAVALLLLGIVVAIIAWINNQGGIEGCHTSFVAASAFKIDNPIKSAAPLKINCDRKKVMVKANEVYYNSEYDPARMNRLLAEEFRQCWYKTAEGKAVPFTRTTGGYDNNCVICAEITLDSVLVKRLAGDGITDPVLEGFSAYFTKTVMGPGDYGNPKWTYSQYISNTKFASDKSGPDYWMEHDPGEIKYDEKKTTIHLNKPFMIVYGYQRMSDINNIFASDYNTLFIAPADDASQMSCDMLYN